MTKRAAIFGSHGFVGRHFARRLSNDGWELTLVDNLSTRGDWSAAALPRNWEFSKSNLRDWLVARTPDKYDLIIHCAAVVGGRLKIDGDPLAVATDLAIDSDFFSWIIKAKRKPLVVYFSSSAVYPIELQTREKHVALAECYVNFYGNRIGMPDQTYGWSKLSGEFLAQKAVHDYGADVKIYRPFSGYGEDQSLDYPFPSIIRRVVAGENPIKIWGSGDQVRDFIHVDDIVECVLQTMETLPAGDPLNIGSGIPTSFTELTAIACKRHYLTGKVVYNAESAPIFSFDMSKPEGVFWRVADIYKMRRLYEPRIALEEGIDRVAMRLTKHKK